MQAQPGRDGVKPLASGTNRYALGDLFAYDHVDHLRDVTTRIVHRVTHADDDRVEINGGVVVFDQMGSILRNGAGTKNPGLLHAPTSIAIGKRWRTAFTNTTSRGVVQTNYWDFRVEALEDIEVPAGAFRAFKVVGNGESQAPSGQTLLAQTYWIDPATMLWVLQHSKYHHMGGPRVRMTEDSSTRLVSLKLAPRRDETAPTPTAAGHPA